MKTKFIVTCFALLATACGTDQESTLTTTSTPQEASTQTEDLGDLGANFVRVESADASIDAVKVRRDHGKKVTDVTIGFAMGCLDKLANVATDVNVKGGQATIRVSGHKVINKNSHLVRCAVANYGKHTVTLKGSFRKSAIKLAPLEDQGSVALESGDLSLRPVDSAQVLSAGLICPSNPNGMHCLAVGSTVTLKVYLGGCMDRLGPVASTFEVARRGKVDLYVKILTIQNEASRRVRCIQAPTANVTLSTLANITSDRDLTVHILN